jgi:hypothetical protein
VLQYCAFTEEAELRVCRSSGERITHKNVKTWYPGHMLLKIISNYNPFKMFRDEHRFVADTRFSRLTNHEHSTRADRIKLKYLWRHE